MSCRQGRRPVIGWLVRTMHEAWLSMARQTVNEVADRIWREHER